MSFHYSPRIVTDDLSLCLDAGDSSSYPGSGTTWTDLANGIVFGSLGTTTPFGTVAGSPALTFNGSGYWQSTGGTSESDKVDMGGDCTLIMWLYDNNITNRRTVFEKAGNPYTSYQQEIAVTWEVSDAWSWYSRYSSYGYGNTSALTLYSWNMMAIKMSTGRTTTARTGLYSKNGAAWANGWVSRSSNALVSAGAVRVGTGYAGAVQVGSVGAVMCYNRMLTDAEIKQNFNAHRSRYGLS